MSVARVTAPGGSIAFIQLGLTLHKLPKMLFTTGQLSSCAQRKNTIFTKFCICHKIYYMKIFCWIICICIAEYISQVRRQRGALGKLVEVLLKQVRFHMGGFVLKQFEHG